MTNACRKCGEPLEESFEACWRCGTVRDAPKLEQSNLGRSDHSNQDSIESADPELVATSGESKSLFDRLPFVGLPIMEGAGGIYIGSKFLLTSGAENTIGIVAGLLWLLQSAAAIHLIIRFVQRRWRWSHFLVWAASVSAALLALPAAGRPGPKGPMDNPFFWIGGIPLMVGLAAFMLYRSKEIDKGL